VPTVGEVTDPYARFMRNLPAPAHGVCATCKTFCPGYEQCYVCSHRWPYADAVLPISFSVHMGQLHAVLRQYKDGNSARARAQLQRDLGALLWRFLHIHEACLARACGVRDFDLVTTVPSSDPERDEFHPLPDIVGRICVPTRDRYARVLARSDKEVEPREVDPAKYRAVEHVSGRRVLLVDDTWTTGANVQSAAGALHNAGAEVVGAVVIGRHIHDDYGSNAERLRALPSPFDWTTCALH
jgi:predicted amidophosphoribosyltransferase